MDKRIIGITGGIGSGKSTVACILRKIPNVEVIDTDKISRDIFENNIFAISEVINFFKSVNIKDLNVDKMIRSGQLNKEVIAQLVFSKHKDLKETYESIMHRYIAAEIFEQVNNSKNKTLVLDAPIPVKHGFLDIVTEIWIITSPLNIREARIANRNKEWSKEQICDRIKSQMSEEEYVNISIEVGRVPCHIIRNKGNFEELQSIVQKNFSIYSI